MRQDDLQARASSAFHPHGQACDAVAMRDERCGTTRTPIIRPAGVPQASGRGVGEPGDSASGKRNKREKMVVRRKISDWVRCLGMVRLHPDMPLPGDVRPMPARHRFDAAARVNLHRSSKGNARRGRGQNLPLSRQDCRRSCELQSKLASWLAPAPTRPFRLCGNQGAILRKSSPSRAFTDGSATEESASAAVSRSLAFGPLRSPAKRTPASSRSRPPPPPP